MFFALVLSQVLQECAPNVGARTMTAIVRVESGGQPLAIHDNTLNQTFVPADVPQAVVWANQLIALHHSVDLGLGQINSSNLQRLGMTVREAFDPCINMNGAATILASDYHAAASKFGPGQYALRRAIGAYNSGSLYAGYHYVQQILAAAGVRASDDFVPNLQEVALPAPASKAPVFLQRRRAASVPAPAGSPGSPYASAILVPVASSPFPTLTPEALGSSPSSPSPSPQVSAAPKAASSG